MKILFCSYIIILLAIAGTIANAADGNCDGGASGLIGCMGDFSSSIALGDNEDPEKVCEKRKAKLTKDFAAACNKFMSATDGSYGEYGKTVEAYIDRKGSDSAFLSDNLKGMSDGPSLCPNWKNMTNGERKNFWVWSMGAIANVESGCKADAKNSKATNGTATGLLQMDDTMSGRKFRGGDCANKNSSMFDATDNINCGMTIMESYVSNSGLYNKSGLAWGKGSNSYWQELRNDGGGKIGSQIRNFPGCN
jgi:hypothetical protein